ncbi:unnamed protein product [Bursaphelenchus okinawaensis]|uniref:Uncharacterized protein n=1 Tax=Bursaphelenchus okinawaensis TaxID=465554 RepID=A0A811L1P1_9BILA|nr:unnamed protein product [Bursaphelenchus okinawaensis]CAG9117103.1 unnamed protein product [Bursaphelenchus okinawaensis]
MASEYKFCCNSHVHNAVISTAIISLFGGGFALFFIIISLLWMFLPLPILAAFGNLSLLLGRCTRTACLYWVYFITQVLYIIGGGIWCFFLFVWGDAIIHDRLEEYFDETHKFKKGLGVYFTVLASCGLLYFLMNIYFLHIAIKSYKYLTRVLSIRDHHVDTVVDVPAQAPMNVNFEGRASAPTFSPDVTARLPVNDVDYHAQPYSQAPANYDAPPAYDQQHMYPVLPQNDKN